MNKIKDWILTHKKISIAIGIATVFVVAVGAIVLTFNARQVVDSRKQIETAEAKQKEEALVKKVEEAKKVLDTKIENVDKLSTEDKNKLEAVKKQLSEAIEKKDEQNIVKFQNELKTALNAAKTNVEKVILEEKKKEEEKKQEEQKAEENKPTENATVSNTTPAPASSASETKPTPKVESKPAETPAPEPTPETKKEEPKTIKYCEYSGNRKPVQNICNNGDWEANSPTGRPLDSYMSKRWKQIVESGRIDIYVFHGETDRYHLIKDEDLRKGLAETPGASCLINGSCTGFNLPGR